MQYMGSAELLSILTLKLWPEYISIYNEFRNRSRSCNKIKWQMLEKFMLSTFFNSEMLIMVTKNTDGFYAHYLKYVEFYSLLN